MPDLDPETLEKLRRGFPLRLDASGGFFLGEDPITHPRVLARFRQGLDLSEAGEPVLRIDAQWTYVKVEDCVLRVLGVRPDEEDRPQLVLDDGRVVSLDVSTLWEEPGRGLRCTAPSQPSQRPLSARFRNQALMDLDRWIFWPEQGLPRLRTGTEDREIPQRPPGQ